MADPDFAEWLRHRALAEGYDIVGTRGAQARLAEATGISSTQIGRTFNGITMPDLASQLKLARTLRIPVPEMLIRSGEAAPEDFPDYAAQRPAQVTIQEAADQWGIEGDDVRLLGVVVKELQQRRLRRETITAVPGTVEIGEPGADS